MRGRLSLMTGRNAVAVGFLALCALCVTGCSSSPNSRSGSQAARAARQLQATATPPSVAVAPGGGLTVSAPSASVVLRDTATTVGPHLNDRQRIALEHS